MRNFDDEHQTTFRIGLDDVTVARLLELAEVCECEPRKILAAIVKGFLECNARGETDLALVETIQ